MTQQADSNRATDTSTSRQTPIPIRPQLFFVLAFLSMASPLATDMYLSGLPAMQRDLGTSATNIQFTLSAFMVGMAIGQLCWGPLSDTKGRRRPLTIAVTFFVLTGVAAAVAPNVWVLIALRFVQGFCGSAGLVISRAIARDLATGIQLAKLLSLMGVVMGIAPVAAPVIGGVLIDVVGWRGILWCVAAVSALMAVCAYLLVPETLPRNVRTAGGLRPQLASLRSVLTDIPFVGYMISAVFGFAAVFAYISSSSVVLQEIYQLSSLNYALFFGINALGMVVVGFINSRLVARVTPLRLLTVAQCVMLTGTTTVFVVSLVSEIVPLGALIPLVLFSTAVNPMIMANTNTLALTRHGTNAGMASALLGSVQFMVAALVSPLVTITGQVSVHAMAVVMLVCAVIGIAGGVLYRTRRFEKPLALHNQG